MAAADQLVAQLKSRHYYTDTSSFDLRCGVCGIGLKGETEAREHARQTGRKFIPVRHATNVEHLQMSTLESIDTSKEIVNAWTSYMRRFLVNAVEQPKTQENETELDRDLPLSKLANAENDGHGDGLG